MGISGEPADKPWDQWFAAMRFGYVDWEIQSNGWYKPKNIDGIDLAKTGYSLLLTTLSPISTTVQVVGQNMLGYTGFAVINDEIVQVNSWKLF